MEDDKKTFIDNLRDVKGIVSKACERSQISRSTYYRWKNTDKEFKTLVEEVTELQMDFVEDKLLSLIDENDTTAIIFYLKTKGKSRGWTEKDLIQSKDKNKNDEAREINRITVDGLKVKRRKDYLIKLLKSEDKYTPEMAMQAKITAQLLCEIDAIEEIRRQPEYRRMFVEYSREGNTRETLNPLERYYLEVVRQAQYSLRALGMNLDAKEQKGSGADAFADFMNDMRDEE